MVWRGGGVVGGGVVGWWGGDGGGDGHGVTVAAAVKPWSSCSIDCMKCTCAYLPCCNLQRW